MAKTKNTKSATKTINRRGIHAKAGSSKLKSSKNYQKKYNRQGRV